MHCMDMSRFDVFIAELMCHFPGLGISQTENESLTVYHHIKELGVF
jgi:hypothetical protein